MWHGTWFGVRLSDDALIEAMSPASAPRDVQHGIEEVTKRYDEGRAGMERWARFLVKASHRPEESVRVSTAWAMGYDPGREEFVARLREIVAADASVLARRNAACALSKSNDASGRDVLRSMFQTFTVATADAGVVSGLPAVDVPLRENAAAGRVRRDDGVVVEVRAPVPGRVQELAVADRSRVAKGDALIVLAPDAKHAFNAAFALARVGTKDDVELLGVAADPRSAFPDDVKVVAGAAIEAIRARGK